MSNNLIKKISQLLSTATLVVTVQSSHAQTPVNFVRSWDAVAPVQDVNALLSKPLKDVKQATQYLDGLGRPIQTVVKQGSLLSGGTATDIVNAIVYDEFGREQYKYLPTVANNAGGNTHITDGAFKENPLQQQAAFYDNTNPINPLKGQGETFFYSKTNFEASPLNRPTKTLAPGNSWVGADRGVAQQYLVNNATDAVIIFDISINNTLAAVPTQTGGAVYAAGELYKTVTIDEHGKQVVEFKDKGGQVVLKKVQIANTVSDGHTGWLCTYYVYDDLGRLRFVVPPLAIEKYLGGATLSSLADELCFKYEYDADGRMIKKKVPGAGEVWMVYDGRDRVVLTQDAKLRTQQKWLYTQYDELNRPIATGLWTSVLTHAQHITNAENSISYPTLSGEEELTRTFYNDYTWVNTYNTGLGTSYSPINDSYLLTPSNNWPYPQANVQTNQLRGVATGSRIKVLGTNTYVYTVNFYDEKGRVIQTQSINNHGKVDITTTQYTWAGQPLVVVQKIEMLGADAEDVFRVITKMNYDDLGRLVEAKKRIEGTYHMDDISKAEQTIVKNEYDALGQLKNKKLGANDIETLTYDYNIRGWMLGANRDYARDYPTSNYFGFELNYDKLGLVESTLSPSGGGGGGFQYNGNIEGMVWKSKGDGEKRKYDYTYDNANRLLKGVFTQYTNSTFNKDAGINYDMQMGDGSDYASAYDANGNIKAMTQFGFKLGGSISTPLDNLTYTYQNNSNKLAKVVDAITGADNGKLGDFKDGANGATDDYSYDVNGNLNLDNNKTIGGITYNHLNLPSTITVTDKGTITYTYDAAGNKLKKVTIENPTTANGNKTITTTTNYVSGFVYESKTISPPDANNPDYTDKLQFFGHEEGRVRYKPAVLSTTGTVITPASLEYDYMLKDHLGNVRMVLTEEQDIARYPAATLETVAYNGGTALSVESQFYTIDNSKVVPKPSGITDYQNNNGPTNPNPYSNAIAYSENVYKIDGVSNRTGLGITLKVMAGDKVDIFGKSYYKTPNGGYSTPTQPALSVLDILNTLVATPVISGKGGITGTQLQSGFPSNVSTMFPNQPGQTSSTPKAFINWVVLDEQFKYVQGSAGFSQVGTSQSVTSHNIPQINIPKNGYIYVYCSNETEGLVFFDNLQLMHTKGAILEETHYYPFGLTMAGISSRAANVTPNKEKTFQGQQIDDDLGLNWIQFKWRNHDPQIGRFIEIDPLSEKYVYNSTYAFSENKVTTDFELEGLESIRIHGKQNHHNKDLSAVVLDKKEILKPHNQATIREKNLLPKGLAGLQSFIMEGQDGVKATEINYVTSLKETITNTTSAIDDNPIGAGKILTLTTSTQETEIKFNGPEIKTKTQTNTVESSTFNILNSDNESITITSTPEATSSTTISNANPKISSSLNAKIKETVVGNCEKLGNATKGLEEAFKKAQETFKPKQ